jgi:hypothetical protein
MKLADSRYSFKNLADKAKKSMLSVLRRKPDFLIVGTQKGGTTSLHVYLKEHPQVLASTGPKELHFFNMYYHKGVAWYLSHFPWRMQARGKLIFEATPDYIAHDIVPKRISKDLGRPKLILTLREPAERAYSAWKMWQSFLDHPTKQNKADTRSFATAVQEELSSPNRQSDLRYHYVSMGCYAEHIENFLQYFHRDDLLVLDYQEMSSNLHGFLKQICDFLGIDEFSKEKCDELGKTRHWVGTQRCPTAEEEAAMAELREYYAPHNEQLFALLGRRLDWQ